MLYNVILNTIFVPQKTAIIYEYAHVFLPYKSMLSMLKSIKLCHGPALQVVHGNPLSMVIRPITWTHVRFLQTPGFKGCQLAKQCLNIEVKHGKTTNLPAKLVAITYL